MSDHFKVERRALNLHIGLLEELEAAASRNLCDSGTGCCELHKRLLAASPSIDLCLRMLRHHRQSVRRMPEKVDPNH